MWIAFGNTQLKEKKNFENSLQQTLIIETNDLTRKSLKNLTFIFLSKESVI